MLSNLTPKYVTRTMAAGARANIGVYGRYITVVGISASTVTISIQDDPEQELVNGFQIDCEQRRYDHFTLHNTGGVPSTVVLYLSETLIVDLRSNAFIAAIAASLAAIAVDMAAIEVLITAGNVDLAALEVLSTAANVDLAALEVLVTAGNVDLAAIEVLLGRLTPSTASTILPQTVVAQTGVGVTQLFAAAATAKEVTLNADIANAGYIYIAWTNAVTAVASFGQIAPAGSWRKAWTGAVWACSTNGTETVRGEQST
jgi:hypothetical protein